jgi:hypothetical protein
MMKKRSKFIVAILLAMYIAIGIYGFMTQVEHIKPPEALELAIVIDLESPDKGIIYVTYPENVVSKDDFDIFAIANSNACDVLNQYYIPFYEDPFSIKPLREDGKVTVALDFFAENKYEFAWPVCTFNLFAHSTQHFFLFIRWRISQ